jgi:hypothetical protein
MNYASAWLRGKVETLFEASNHDMVKDAFRTRQSLQHQDAFHFQKEVMIQIDLIGMQESAESKGVPVYA